MKMLTSSRQDNEQLSRPNLEKLLSLHTVGRLETWFEFAMGISLKNIIDTYVHHPSKVWKCLIDTPPFKSLEML